jgi:hypothetical protein
LKATRLNSFKVILEKFYVIYSGIFRTDLVERRYERLPKRPAGLSVVLLMTYPRWLGYTGNLRSGWYLWWLLLEGIYNPKGKPWISACYSVPQLSG